MRRALLVLFVLALGFGAGWYARQARPSESSTAGGRKILYWHDPMHPWYKSDKPGIAPDCNMPLEPVYADSHPTAPQSDRKPIYYRDPKDPKYRSDKPGINPETGNDLEPAFEEPGTVQIAADRLQLIGVKYGTAEHASTQRTFRAVGRVVVDETKIVRIHPRVEGWIETVHADHIGEAVKRGQPLLTLYSPELLASQQEYLLAIRGAEILKNSPVPDSDRQAYALIDASRRRLELFDLSEAQIEEVAKTGKPIRNITLYAPANGYIMARNAFPKQRVMPDTELYQLADLSRVWIMADVFESDAVAVHIGQSAAVDVQDRRFTAKVSHILPTVDPQTRTLKVRLEAPNPNTALKPDMYVDVNFAVAGRQRLTVPAEAVINTGLRQVVYVDAGNGRFEPRTVQLGESLGDRVVIMAGVNAGERVVTSGNFLIDSESQLRTGAPAAAGAPVAEGSHDRPHH